MWKVGLLLCACATTSAAGLTPQRGIRRARVRATLAEPPAAAPPGAALSIESLRASKARGDDLESVLLGTQPFPLDGFQHEALCAMLAGENVLLSAPTGSGKTVVGELAVLAALAGGRRAVYTTPLKALSNQKFFDFCERFGSANVGLLTGDVCVQRDAPILLMTTEVFRNMLFDEPDSRRSRKSRMRSAAGPAAGVGDGAAEAGGSGLIGEVGVCVLDEFHWMGDRARGVTWEEVVIHAPRGMQLVGLSATVPNGEQLRRWIEATHGKPTRLVRSDDRPVPLRFHFVDGVSGLRPLFSDPAAMPAAVAGSSSAAAAAAAADDPGNGLARKRKASGFGGESVARGRGAKAAKKPPALQINPDLLTLTTDGRRAGGADVRRMGASSGGGMRAAARRASRGNADTRLSREAGGRRSVGGSARTVRGWDDFPSAAAPRPRAPSPPSMPYLLRCLQRKGMLPAIVFIFSRAACDQAAAAAAADARALLTAAESRELRARVDAFEKAQRAVAAAGSGGALVEPAALALLRSGVASHHAGQLPAYKKLAERLFADNLLKAVFATETLAAGVNMPCRTAVVTSLSKRGNSGIEPLGASSLLQMAGRAGRRGKDAVGHVVISKSRWEGAEDAFRMVQRPADPIESHFLLSYASVLRTVVTAGGLDGARRVLDRSYGAFVRREADAAREARRREAAAAGGADGGAAEPAPEGGPLARAADRATEAAALRAQLRPLLLEACAGAREQALGGGERGAGAAPAVAAVETSALADALEEQLNLSGVRVGAAAGAAAEAGAVAGAEAAAAAEAEMAAEAAMSVLEDEARAYAKLADRLAAETNVLGWLAAQAERDVAQRHADLLPFCRPGARLLLRARPAGAAEGGADAAADEGAWEYALAVVLRELSFQPADGADGAPAQAGGAGRRGEGSEVLVLAVPVEGAGGAARPGGAPGLELRVLTSAEGIVQLEMDDIEAEADAVLALATEGPFAQPPPARAPGTPSGAGARARTPVPRVALPPPICGARGWTTAEDGSYRCPAAELGPEAEDALRGLAASLRAMPRDEWADDSAEAPPVLQQRARLAQLRAEVGRCRLHEGPHAARIAALSSALAKAEKAEHKQRQRAARQLERAKTRGAVGGGAEAGAAGAGGEDEEEAEDDWTWASLCGAYEVLRAYGAFAAAPDGEAGALAAGLSGEGTEGGGEGTAAAGEPAPELSEFGRLVASLGGENEVFLAAVLMGSHIFDGCAPHEAAAALSCLAAGEMRQGSACFLEPSERVLQAAAQIEPIACALLDAQAEAGVEYAVSWSAQYAGLVQAWAAGMEWSEVMDATALDAGDVLRLLSRTLELLRQTLNAPFVAQPLRDSVREALHHFDRPPLSNDFLFMARATEGAAEAVAAGALGEGEEEEEEDDDDDDYMDEDEEEELDDLIGAYGMDGGGEDGRPWDAYPQPAQQGEEAARGAAGGAAVDYTADIQAILAESRLAEERDADGGARAD